MVRRGTDEIGEEVEVDFDKLESMKEGAEAFELMIDGFASAQDRGSKRFSRDNLNREGFSLGAEVTDGGVGKQQASAIVGLSEAAVKAKVQGAAASSVTMVSDMRASPSSVRKKTSMKNVDPNEDCELISAVNHIYQVEKDRSGGILLGVNLDFFDIGSIEESDFYVKFRIRNKVDGFRKKSLPLLIGGDCNIIRNPSEKNKDNYNDKWPFLFNAVIDSLNLGELHMSGRKFTWTNSLEIPTYERLDRILVSTEWEQKFPLATVVALTREISDHTPLLLNTGARSHSSNPPLFQFELGWLLRKGFHDPVAKFLFLSILQYADDTILLLEHDLEEAKNMKLVLNNFEQLSGLKINFHKSELFLYGEAKNFREEYVQLFGCKEGPFPFRYLGISMHHRKINNKDWISVEERFQKKLGSWKGKLLSAGGRPVLINSVFSSLPMFMLSFFEAPKGVLKELDYYKSRFFWQCDEYKKKYRLAKWGILRKPKHLGGLGILNLEVQNRCLLSKWLFKLINEDGLWQDLLKRKESTCLISLFLKCPRNPVIPIFGGNQARFWEDCWIEDKPLMEVYPSLYHIVRKKAVTVASVLKSIPLNVSFHKSLTCDNLRAWYKLVSKVTNINLSEENDTFKWRLHKNGIFSVKSMYNNLILDNTIPVTCDLWKLRIPLKIKIFLWYLRTEVILTKDNLAKRRWQGSTKCCFCHADETIQHLFFDCHLARGTYWIRSWSPLFKEEEKRTMRTGCSFLETTVMKIFNKFGWKRSLSEEVDEGVGSPEVGVIQVGAPHVPCPRAVGAHLLVHGVLRAIRLEHRVLGDAVEQPRHRIVAADCVMDDALEAQQRHVVF
ncbi:hypothetical protein U9M48_002262 [Paspalum notatum var. saurae]|uniref:Reverse transcriptase zinc-binding domain-containing protein n=1 Tax=Paspalum notatum var. saurae TaxID=547442 RepID=A0AAQ3SDE2_PASNO